MAPSWPLPQGLLGEVASEGLLFSRRTSMEEGVGLRNSFLRRGIKEKGQGTSSLWDVKQPTCVSRAFPPLPSFPASHLQLLGLTQGWSEERPS